MSAAVVQFYAVTMRSILHGLGFLMVSVLLVGCSTASRLTAVADSAAISTAADAPRHRAGTSVDGTPMFWEHYRLPGKKPTQYDFAALQAPAQVRARSDGSASMLRAPVQVAPNDLGTVSFSWQVPALIANADMGRREADDAPARLVLAFEGDRSRFSAKDALLSELARAITGEEMPYATLMYVWCNQRPVGSVIAHPRTDRIKAIVVESGHKTLGQWRHYRRDVAADYRKAFQEAPGTLVGVALMTDSDNTASTATALYGAVHLRSSAEESTAH